MPLVTWTSDLEIGIPFIDSDHRLLVNLLNQVDSCMESHEERFILDSVLSALVDYTRHHFRREEHLMERGGYPGASDHRRAHLSLAQEVDLVRERFRSDDQSVSAVEVRDFLRNWLVQHILGKDFDYRSFCIGNEEAIDEAGSIVFFEGDSVAVAPSWQDLSILLVDDNPNFRRLVKTVLRAVGVRNLQAVASAAEGLEVLYRRPTHVVLCDWIMDDMDGGEFTRLLRRLQVPSKVILLTGFSSDDIRRRAGDVGADGYLEKPFTPYDLFQAVAQAFGGGA